MRNSNVSRILGILALAVIVGVLIGWWVSRTPKGLENITQPEVPDLALSKSAPPSLQPPKEEMATETDSADPNAPFDPALWDEKLDEILGDADDDTDRKANQLLELMEKVGPDAQEEIAGHVVNLIDDKDFHKAAKYLTNAEVPEAISSVFMNDLYNRDEVMKMPLLLAVARNDNHPLREEAKDLLELYREEDYGTDWTKWEEATKKYLKEHGETGEPAATEEKQPE